MGALIREMLLADYDAVVALWNSTPGVDIRPVTDSRDGIERLLARNPGLSVVAVNDRELVGCALASHDGRRGFLQHVVVAPSSARSRPRPGNDRQMYRAPPGTSPRMGASGCRC